MPIIELWKVDKWKQTKLALTLKSIFIFLVEPAKNFIGIILFIGY